MTNHITKLLKDEQHYVRAFVGFGLARSQDRDCNRVLVHVQAQVRSVLHGRSTSVCGHRAAHTARDPRIFRDGPAVSS